MIPATLGMIPWGIVTPLDASLTYIKQSDIDPYIKYRLIEAKDQVTTHIEYIHTIIILKQIKEIGE